MQQRKRKDTRVQQGLRVESKEKQERGGGEELWARWQLRGQRKQGPKKPHYCSLFCLAFPAERLLPNGSGQVDCSFLRSRRAMPPAEQGSNSRIRDLQARHLPVAALSFLPRLPSLFWNASALPRHSLPGSIGLTIVLSEWAGLTCCLGI